MVYVYENLGSYSEALYESHLSSLPEWRKAYALKYKKSEDRKRSVLAFVLLREAVKREFGEEIQEFEYNQFGKPFLKGNSLHFSLSHCKSAVACAVSESEIGIDLETVREFDEKLSARVLTGTELKLMESAKDPKELFFKFWTQKEAAAKFEGVGLGLVLQKLELSNYLLHSEKREDFVLSVCYGKTAQPKAFQPKAPSVITVDNDRFRR